VAKAYTPGLKVSPHVRHRVRRMLPLQGDVLVKTGDRTEATDLVAKTLMPGDVTPLNLANLLSLPPADVRECMLKQQGERIEVGEPLARTKGIFGLMKHEYRSKIAGTIETVSDITGQLIVRGEPIPVQLLSYLAGEVVEILADEGCVVEADVCFVQGIFGIGGEAFGTIRLAARAHDQELTEDLIHEEMAGAIVIGGARVTAQALRRAIEVGAAAVVSGGMDDHDLRELLGYDLGVAITGNEKVGLTVVLTEGFGEIAMAERTYALLASHAGARAAINGATQIRAGVMRPELLIPLSEDARAAVAESRPSDGTLDVGLTVRIIRDPYFGLIGTVAALPPEPRVLESGSKARVLEVALGGGAGTVVVPRANVELIEG